MQDTELYNALLGLRHPWRVREVKLDLAGDRVDVWVEEVARAVWECPECGNKAPLYDHAQERVWRHLNTCQCQTYLHARLVRVKCAEHGVRQVPAPWAGPGSQFTLRCEGWLIDTLKECDVTGVTRLTGTSWDEAWGIVQRAVGAGTGSQGATDPAVHRRGREGVCEAPPLRDFGLRSQGGHGGVGRGGPGRRRVWSATTGSSRPRSWQRSRRWRWTCGTPSWRPPRSTFPRPKTRSCLTTST